MRESITISIRPTYPFTCAPAVFNLFHTDHHQRDTTLSEFDHVSAVLACWNANPVMYPCSPCFILSIFCHKQVLCLSPPCFIFIFCIQRLSLPGRRQVDEMLHPADYWEKEALKYFRFSSILMTPADRCSKRRLPRPCLITVLPPADISSLYYNTVVTKGHSPRT